jgi:phage baseplate assembly protein W
MPIPQTIRVNPLDLQKRIAIGVSLPFNGPGVFNKTYTTKDQIKSNLINLLLTNKGERIMNPEFGSDIKKSLFDNITSNLTETLTEKIAESVSIFIPQIILTDVQVTNSNVDNNQIGIMIQYRLKISNEPDQITVQFI